jgi:hypothetical protein
MNDIEQKYKELRAIAEEMRELLNTIPYSAHVSWTMDGNPKATDRLNDYEAKLQEALKSFEAFKAKEGE